MCYVILRPRIRVDNHLCGVGVDPELEGEQTLKYQTLKLGSNFGQSLILLYLFPIFKERQGLRPVSRGFLVQRACEGYQVIKYMVADSRGATKEEWQVIQGPGLASDLGTYLKKDSIAD